MSVEKLYGLETVLAKYLVDFKKQNGLTNTEMLQLVARFNFSCAAWSAREMEEK